MSDPTITEATIRSLATPESFSRGEQYYRPGMVSDIERRGDVLRAEVEGSSYTPYRVTIELDESGIISTDCTCPYDWGGCCKHIVAVLLTYVCEREEIAEQPAPEALLTADLPEAERQAWASRLEKWQAELDDYGVDDAFDAALCAAEYGWAYAPLKRAMRGEVAPGEALVAYLNEEMEEFEDDLEEEDEDKGPWFANELTEAWLNVLERQGRTDEFLNLAHATGRITRYVTMLVKAGRMQEAIDYGSTQPLAPATTLALAKMLRERGEHRAALRIAERGLDWGGPQAHELTVWVREVATALGDIPVALRAARRAFEDSTTLADYLAVQAVAGESWAPLREELLRELDGRTFTWISGPIDIYLHEGLIGSAVKLADSQPYLDHATLAYVVDAAVVSHPDWVIRRCRRQAEPIMDLGQSQHYGHALDWLEKVKRACLVAGREDEWRAYCEALIAKHARKYKLAPGLKALLAGR